MRGYPVMVNAPASCLLTTPQAAAEDLGVEFDPRLDRLVQQASALCEGYCGRRFGRATWLETFDGFDFELLLSAIPVVRIESLAVSGVPLDVAGWRVKPDSGLLTWRRNARVHFGSDDETEVRYVAGWLLPGEEARDLPPDVERACLETVKFLYFSTGANARDPTVRANGTEGIGQTSWMAPQAGASSLPGTAADALRPYQLVRA